MNRTIRFFILGIVMSSLAVNTFSQSVWQRHTIDDSSQGADGVRLADVNGDGLPDITVGWEEGGVIRMYLHPGADQVKQCWPAVTVGQVGSPEDAVFADLDGDGAWDVVSCCEGYIKTIFIHWAPSDPVDYLDSSKWKTEAFPATRNRQAWMFCLPLSIDGKHGVDLVVGAKGEHAEIGWLESPPNPRDLSAWRWHSLYKAGWIMSLLAVDMDADGDLDILASDRKQENRGCLWLENPGFAGVLNSPWKEHRIGATDKEFMFLDYADLNGDGAEDVLVAVSGSELVYYQQIPNDPKLQWKTVLIELPPNAGTGKAVRIADIDLNGKTDIVFSCENAKDKLGVMWMSYRETVLDKTWDAHDISGLEGTKFDLIELLDLDADGDLDVITCEERENLGVIWYENPAK
ncbi:MAG: VCBS repeat-containing protein [Candidatus Omnitrophota bacterium]|jgi:hypothetical protein|nr:MAG: VCBS repeat-containing protein [Candidatus Omnitrophota bacterium]